LEIEKLMKINEIKAFKIIEKLLENEPINLLQYESSVINGKMEEVWDIITDFNKLTAIAPNNNFLPNINIKTMKIGEKVETSIILNEELKKIDLYLRIKDERPRWNKWIIILEIYYENKLNHSLLFQLTKINNNECQFSIISKFHAPLKTENFKEISKREKYLILSVKDFFNNFFSPNF
jgi:predicted RNA-binding protein with RPS1 domain